MIKRIHNEKNTTQCLSKGRGETGCRREQQANGIRYRFSIEKYKVEYIQRSYI